MIGRDSPYSLYDQDLVTFEEGAVAYDHQDASGFIKLNALRLRTLAKRKKKAKAKRLLRRGRNVAAHPPAPLTPTLSPQAGRGGSRLAPADQIALSRPFHEDAA